VLKGAGEDALGVGVVVGFGKDAQNQPPLLRHAQAGGPKLPFKNGDALLDSRHTSQIASESRFCKSCLLLITLNFIS
jgi:hypothetical protein